MNNTFREFLNEDILSKNEANELKSFMKGTADLSIDTMAKIQDELSEIMPYEVQSKGNPYKWIFDYFKQNPKELKKFI